jgi:hypothetical protein
MSRETCRAFALDRSWESCARQFIGNLSIFKPSRLPQSTAVPAGARVVQG